MLIILKLQVEETRNRCEEFTNKLDFLTKCQEDKIKVMKTQHEKQVTELLDQKRAQESEYSRCLTERNNEQYNLEEENSKLRNQLKHQENEFARMYAEMENRQLNLEKTNSELRKQLQLLESELTSKIAERENNQCTLEEANCELRKQLQRQESEFTRRLADYSSEQDRLEKANNDLQNQIASQECEFALKTAEKENQKCTLEETNAELQDRLRRQECELSCRFSELNNEQNRLSQENCDLREQIRCQEVDYMRRLAEKDDQQSLLDLENCEMKTAVDILHSILDERLEGIICKSSNPNTTCPSAGKKTLDLDRIASEIFAKLRPCNLKKTCRSITTSTQSPSKIPRLSPIFNKKASTQTEDTGVSGSNKQRTLRSASLSEKKRNVIICNCNKPQLVQSSLSHRSSSCPDIEKASSAEFELAVVESDSPIIRPCDNPNLDSDNNACSVLFKCSKIDGRAANGRTRFLRR